MKTFTNPADFVEWIAVTHGIIKALEGRGYGAYRLGRGPMMFADVEMIMEFVQFGRAEDVLEVGYRYLLLPLIKDSKDTFQMRKALEEMFTQLRGPFFTNILLNGKGEPLKVSPHLIDSISIEPPFLNLHCDVRFNQVTTENTIEIHLSGAINAIKKQLMMSLRQVMIPRVKGETNAGLRLPV